MSLVLSISNRKIFAHEDYYKTKGFYHFDLHFVTLRKNALGLVFHT